ncbi:MAG TPA: hypothetical protein VML55_08460 [Planctomycetaceae bacterium]|nr:hypothetical protein [Planctomycetaceae bacterium]
MTLDDLARALDGAVAAGRIGTPVALRVHAVLPAGGDLVAALAALMRRLAEPLFGPPGRLTARRDADERQLHALASYPSGPTVLVTLAATRSRDPSLELLVVGNHGVIRLEGGECFAGLPPSADAGAAEVERYRELVAAGLHGTV